MLRFFSIWRSGALGDWFASDHTPPQTRPFRCDWPRSGVTVAIKVQEKSRLAEFGGVDRVVAERNLHLQLEAGGSCAFIVKMLGAFQVSSAAGFLNAQRKFHGRVLIRA